MDNKQLSESDISDKFVRPAVVRAGWHTLDQIYAQFPLRAGRVVVRGKAAKRDANTVLRADFALFLKPNIPLAILKVKKSRLSMQAGMQQAIDYAQLLDVPFCFASNGDGFVFRDATLATGVLEQNITLDQFPSPQALWARYCTWKGWTPEVRGVAAFDYALSTTHRRTIPRRHPRSPAAPPANPPRCIWPRHWWKMSRRTVSAKTREQIC